jgi:hypothetical protein
MPVGRSSGLCPRTNGLHKSGSARRSVEVRARIHGRTVAARVAIRGTARGRGVAPQAEGTAVLGRVVPAGVVAAASRSSSRRGGDVQSVNDELAAQEMMPPECAHPPQYTAMGDH